MGQVDDLVQRAARAEGIAAKAEIKALRAEVKRLERAVHAANVRAGVVDGLRAGARAPKPVRYTKNLHRRVATPVFHFSDFHVEETVKPEKVLGLNEYTPAIAAERIARVGKAAAWMIDHHRTSFEIREAVVIFGGDFMSGYIHEELAESNALSPVQTLLFLQEHLPAGLIEPILAVPGIERVRFVCTRGNHGRTTQRIRISTGAENSYEWLLYQQLRKLYEANRRTEWNVANGEFIHINVSGLDLGVTHGDAVNYGGGVGGIMIPIRRAIPRWNSFQHADIWHVSHFHDLHDLPDLVINGSLIGTAPYGMRVGGYRLPAQASYLIDHKRKVKCMSTTLWPTGSAYGKVA